MFRALLELIITIIVAMAARAILGSLMKGFSNAARAGTQDTTATGASEPRRQRPPEQVKVAGELHKDPVCGMYVSETTQFQRRSGREVSYYCSEKCKDLHAVTAKA